MSVTSVTGEVPLELGLGEVPRMPTDMVVNRQAATAQLAAKAFSTLIHEIIETTQECLQLVQAHMVAQASKHHCNAHFAVHDQVLLDTCNLNFAGSKKLKAVLWDSSELKNWLALRPASWIC